MRIDLLLYYILVFILKRFYLTKACYSAYYPATNCLDKLDHYECSCKQGQSWNGYSCVADSVDSRLVFNGSHFPSFIKLDSKTFPRTSEITIAFWLRIWPKRDSSQHTILFYKTDDVLPVLLVSLIDNSRLHVELLNNIYDVSMPLAMEHWHHISIAHNLARNEGIKILVNGSLVVVFISSKPTRYDKRTVRTSIDSGGDLIVGQALRQTNQSSISTTEDSDFDLQHALYGELVYLNIWQKVLSDYELNQLAVDCDVQRRECGDAIAWMDFVNDIKGGIKIHWPSGIYSLFGRAKEEFEGLKVKISLLQRIVPLSNGSMNRVTVTVDNSKVICLDTFSRKDQSRAIGPHCKNESQLSIIWQKAVAGETVVKQCPGQITNGSVYRRCQRIEQIARWTHVEYSECTHPLINTIDQELENTNSDKEEIHLLRDKTLFLAETLTVNLTSTQLYSTIDLILLIEQIERLTKVLTSHFDSLSQWYSSAYESFYHADINATLHIHRFLVESISNLIDQRYYFLWMGTNPLGNDFLRLLNSLQQLTMIISGVLIDDCQIFPKCSFEIQTENINQTIQILNRNDLHLFSYENQPTNTKISFVNTKNFNRTLTNAEEKNSNSTWYAVSITVLRTAHRYIPNLRLGRVSKYDNLNTHLTSIDIKLRKPIQRSNRLSALLPTDNLPILITMGYLKYDNISGNRCVFLETTNGLSPGQYKATLFRQWHWQSSPSVCNISHSSLPDESICSCLISNGTFAITSDMFDPNWRPTEFYLSPLGIFSYMGAIIHISFALATLFMLNYLRTHSSATYIHKHYAFTLCCSQVILISAFNGISYQHPYICRSVACITHFFILSSYCWLMNEAFNLYIQITYTTHPAVAGASATLSDAASKYRFLGMGYILPFCIVTLLATIKKSTYFMPFKSHLCFINLEDWFKICFIPISAIIFITIMVMIFSAKQHHESSYTKNEKANEVIVTYTGGIWSQLFLITVSWVFAMLPYFYDETIIRLLHGFFSGLQGGFLFLSFFLFNDEIRRHYRDRRRQLRRIQLMEIPYRSSNAGSEGQRSSIAAPSVSPPTLVGTRNSSVPSSPTKLPSVASAVQSLMNRNRQRSQRHYVYDEMKWSLRRRSSNKGPDAEENLLNDQKKESTSENSKDYRVTVV